LTTMKLLSYFYCNFNDVLHLPDNQSEVNIIFNLKYYYR